MKSAGKQVDLLSSWRVGTFFYKAGFRALSQGVLVLSRSIARVLDRQALQAGVDILATTNRPLVVFPEGVISRTNDRLLSLMEGTSFIARSAAKKKKAKGRVVVHPIGLRYRFEGDIEATLNETLDSIEQASFMASPDRIPDLTTRIYRVGEALLLAQRD